MTGTPAPGPTVVLGVGTRFRRDDAVGLEVAERLRLRALPGVRVEATEADGSRYLDLWEGCPVAIVVDATRSGAAPGTVRRWATKDGILPESIATTSTHGVSVAHACGLGRALGRLPSELVLFGIEGMDFRV